MTAPVPNPRRQVLRIGPGGLPADQVRPSGPGAQTGQASDPASTRWLRPPESPRWPATAQELNKWGLSGTGGPAASGRNTAGPHTGSPPSRALVRVVVGLCAFGVVVALGFWVKSLNPLIAAGSGRGASDIAVGDCLSATDQRIIGQVGCTSAAADFAVVGISAESSDASDCSSTPSDVVVVASGPTVLCLDYVASVGQCLFAGDTTTQVGKIDCSTGDPGVFRVLAVLRNSIDPQSCPADTSQTLVHRYNSQVLCLGAN